MSQDTVDDAVDVSQLDEGEDFPQDFSDQATTRKKQAPPPPTAGELALLAVQKKKYADALAHVSQALKEALPRHSPTSHQIPELLITRSQAYLGLQRNYKRALEDTERAYHLASTDTTAVRAATRGRLPNVRIASFAQFRRAVVLGALKRYADADACCVWAQHLLEGRVGSGVSLEDEAAVLQKVDADGNYTVRPDDLPATLDERPLEDPLHDEGTFLKLNQATDAPAAWSRAYMWRGFVLREMLKTPANDPGRKLTVRRIPPQPTTPLDFRSATEEDVEVAATDANADADADADADATAVPASEEQISKDAATSAADTTAASNPTQANSTIVPITLPAAAATPALPVSPAKLRVDMYQSTNKVILTVYAKRVDGQLLRIEAGPTTLRLLNLPKEVSGPSGTVMLQLGGAIDETDITKQVTPYKIELRLTKRTLGEKWGSWGEQVEEADVEVEVEGESGQGKYDVSALVDVLDKVPLAAPPATAPPPTEVSAAAASASAAVAGNPVVKPSGPVYPTSSRSGPKNWDKLVVDGDDDGDGEEKSVDAFFKQLYANSTPEQQRAMNKSFTESNGTSLSTDWTTVSKEKVAVKPPDGVEAKSWDERARK
ncbi:MAG: Cochaperone protein [Sporothrix thermara]